MTTKGQRRTHARVTEEETGGDTRTGRHRRQQPSRTGRGIAQENAAQGVGDQGRPTGTGAQTFVSLVLYPPPCVTSN